jgi:hypothetical protein
VTAPWPSVQDQFSNRWPNDCHECGDAIPAPFRAVIQAKLDQGLSAQRIWQDLQAEHGFQHSYYSVLRFVSRLQPGQALPFRRLERAPGEEAQVDFGVGAPLVSAALVGTLNDAALHGGARRGRVDDTSGDAIPMISLFDFTP